MSSQSNSLFTSNELIFGILLFFLSAFLIAELRWSRLQNSYAIHTDSPVHLYLDSQTDFKTLSQTLADSGLINDQGELRWAADLMGWKTFQKGHYLVDRGFTYQEFLSKLGRGIQDPVSVTVLPGKSMGQIIDKLAEALQPDSLAFHHTFTDSVVLARHNLNEKELIGRLYPNTYSLFWTSSPEKVLQRILREFNKAVVTQHEQQIDSLNYSLNEILTLASIVEWEAKSEEEKATISGLYWNRLERGMRLQADPTVNYALGERRRLLYEDYQIEHPYNTYVIRGLPPGPITNPSLNAIKATIYPKEHDYLYMVASPDGTHDFSETFEEHKQKSERWRRWLRKQYRIKEQQNSQ
ncbi:UPF0755 protein [Fodinibius salinus]|uniref:Endolytic murein transglycosylase n=1 Tax=Fodinibius salinus TaxID=860790 RepID=A0A5D3YQD3_9BACT|nr:endolytic transglycosylase MltG [Fodinibius salinus]TYP95183.1 UPF0755 protein [Fodinibius salinus]